MMVAKRKGRLSVLAALRDLRAVNMWADARSIALAAGVAHLRDVPRRIRELREYGHTVGCRRIPGTYQYEYLLGGEPGEAVTPKRRGKPEGEKVAGLQAYSLMAGDADYAADRLANMVRSLKQQNQHMLASKLARVIATLRQIEGGNLI